MPYGDLINHRPPPWSPNHAALKAPAQSAQPILTLTHTLRVAVAVHRGHVPHGCTGELQCWHAAVFRIQHQLRCSVPGQVRLCHPSICRDEDPPHSARPRLATLRGPPRRPFEVICSHPPCCRMQAMAVLAEQDPKHERSAWLAAQAQHQLPHTEIQRAVSASVYTLRTWQSAGLCEQP